MHQRQLKKTLQNYREQLTPKNFFWIFTIVFLSSITIIIIINLWIASTYSSYKFTSINEVPKTRVAIVFGAGLWGDTPSHVLEDRVIAAVELYEEGKVEKIIMTGDNRTSQYDEPGAMIELAKTKGIPDSVLQPDYAGRRTYDSCLRAREIFNIEEAILVTQSFHMNRALYTCNSLGIEALGFVAEERKYKGDDNSYYIIRDYLATIKAVWELNVAPPDDVIMGEIIEL